MRFTPAEIKGIRAPGRLIHGLMQVQRLPEVLRCRAVTQQWQRLTAAYLGLPVKLPFSINLHSGPFEFREISDVPTFWQVFFAELYAVHPDYKLVIDAGANVGTFTLYALLRAAQCHVIAIEPAPDLCDRLRAAVRQHGFERRCTIIEAALWDSAGRTTISMRKGSQFRKSGTGGVEVPAVTLDEIVSPRERVDLLKLDIEGAEYRAIAAASAETLRRVGHIEVEFHPPGEREKVCEQLRECGFEREFLREQGYGYSSARFSAKGVVQGALPEGGMFFG